MTPSRVSRMTPCLLCRPRVPLLACLLSVRQKNQVRGSRLPVYCSASCLHLYRVGSEKKKRKTRGDHFKQRFRKNFTALLEEEVGLWDGPPFSASAGSADSSLCTLSGRTCPSDLSQTTCQQRPRPPRFPLDTSAASAATLHTTPALPAGGATAAASVCARTERPGTCPAAAVRQIRLFVCSARW